MGLWGGQGLRRRSVCFPRVPKVPKVPKVPRVLILKECREKFIPRPKDREKIIPRTKREKGFNLNSQSPFNSSSS